MGMIYDKEVEYDEDYDDGVDPLEDDDDFGECGLMADGTCLLAGTEHCDWECPLSG